MVRAFINNPETILLPVSSGVPGSLKTRPFELTSCKPRPLRQMLYIDVLYVKCDRLECARAKLASSIISANNFWLTA